MVAGSGRVHRIKDARVATETRLAAVGDPRHRFMRALVAGTINTGLAAGHTVVGLGQGQFLHRQPRHGWCGTS